MKNKYQILRIPLLTSRKNKKSRKWHLKNQSFLQICINDSVDIQVNIKQQNAKHKESEH